MKWITSTVAYAEYLKGGFYDGNLWISQYRVRVVEENLPCHYGAFLLNFDYSITKFLLNQMV